LSAAPGDHFIGLDLVRDHAQLARPAIAALRASGVRIGFVVYDLLPLQHPEWFPDGIQEAFAEWLRLVAEGADRAVCISGCVASDVRIALAGQSNGNLPRIATFRLGDDPQALVPAGRRLPLRTPGATRWLMVGTLEPRKAHAQALAAFDRLWAEGAAVELAIAGRPGWCAPGLLERLDHHAERGHRLHWLDAADDSELLAAYADCDVLLAASLGEGYGLPLVEAARAGLPILARDLPVFHEVAGDGADYFQADDADALARAILDWMDSRARGEVADCARVPRHGWRESAAELASALVRD
jgi:glycosyltransferase involved in cell wall biosynthesis